jgi:hypothetical protein
MASRRLWRHESFGVLRRENMERETGFEPATLALARRCSTTELFPPISFRKRVRILLIDYT